MQRLRSTALERLVAVLSAEQVRSGRRGDVLFAHYLLGHNIGGNDGGNRTRRAVHWRLRALGHASRWEDCLADPWLEHHGVRHRVGRSAVAESRVAGGAAASRRRPSSAW